MMSPESQKVIQFVDVLRRKGLAERHRYGVMLSGEYDWGTQLAELVAGHFKQCEQLWISPRAPEGVVALTHRAVLKRLGSETDLLIYDAHSGFDADSFATASGLLRAGGLLLQLTPSLSGWPKIPDPEAERFFKQDAQPSRFIKRLITVAQQSSGFVMLSQADDVPEITSVSSPIADDPALPGYCRTTDQSRAVDAIMAMATGEHNACVLVSDRGRGKSAALGIAAAQLLRQGCQRIVVTGPRLNAAATVFQHAAAVLGNAVVQNGVLAYDKAQLEFMAPDILIELKPVADLLLVDEAAAIPAPMLTALLSVYKRIVFATTVHGYEGTGRSFDLRFNKVLDQKVPDWQQVRLQQPIRWAVNDPLEKFIFDALLLNAEPVTESDLDLHDVSCCQPETICRDQLLQDESLLSQMFGLLVMAHYRTRPNDLRQLLDSPALHLHIMRQRQAVVGVILLLEEGGIEEKLAQQIYQGRRRLQGHLLPQSLAYYSGLPDAPERTYLRIMRIAIHPAMQNRGLGTRLVEYAIQQSHRQGYDAVGTSFGVTIELLRFWRQLGFRPARLGLTREHSSGEHSLVMLHPLSEAGHVLARQAEKHMQAQLPLLLNDALRTLAPEITNALSDSPQSPGSVLELNDWQDIISFAFALRPYECCIAAISLLVNKAAKDSEVMNALDEKQRQMLIFRVIQRQSCPHSQRRQHLLYR